MASLTTVARGSFQDGSTNTSAAAYTAGSSMLPCTPMSPPGRALRSRTRSSIGPEAASALCHGCVSGVDVTTYFSTPLMKPANGSSSGWARTATTRRTCGARAARCPAPR